MNFENKNVLVTGGAGFIGSTLVRELLKDKANVVVYDNFLIGDTFNIEEIRDDVKIVIGNILDKNLKHVLQKNNIEFIFNLAAEPYIPACYDRPEHFFEINANGTLNVLLSAKAAGVTRILHYSTSEVYGSALQLPMNENHPTHPQSTYAVSKLAADRLCYTLHHEQGIPVIVLRQFNVFGPRETQPYVIPEIISQLHHGNKLVLGNIKARRDFTYVTDAAQGAMELIKYKEAEGQVYNSGTGSDHSIEEIARIAGEIIGHPNVEITTHSSRMRPLDVDHLRCDNSKIVALTGWKPKTDFREGMKLTIENFRNNGKRWIWESKIRSEEKMWQ